MASFRYKRIQQMDPRPGHKFSTTYYKQAAEDYELLKSHVEQICDQINQQALLDPEIAEQLLKPIPGHRRRDQTPYTAVDILLDLRDQLRLGRDATESLIARWNRIFEENPEVQILLYK